MGWIEADSPVVPRGKIPWTPPLIEVGDEAFDGGFVDVAVGGEGADHGNDQSVERWGH